VKKKKRKGEGKGKERKRKGVKKGEEGIGGTSGVLRTLIGIPFPLDPLSTKRYPLTLKTDTKM